MKENKKEHPNLLPSHYYTENGLLVFTEEFHLNRGFCCGNKCKHCPYEPKGQKGNTTTKK